MRFILALFLAGCGASSRIVRGPDGTSHHYIECRRNIGNCYDEAAELCPRGYTIANSGSEEGAVVVPAGNSFAVAPTFRGNMLIKCR